MHECTLCVNQMMHDGKCYGKYSGTPCLMFKKDPRGYPIHEDLTFPVPFGLEIPKVQEECNYYTIGGIEKTIKILKINHIEWLYNGKGINGITIKAHIRYWSEENGIITKKPKLKLIQGGKQCQE